MRKALTLALAGTTAAGAVAFSTNAAAYDYRYGRSNDNNTAATAVIAGVIGLAIGAAIASNNDDRDDRYRYDRYGRHGYGYGNSYGSPYYGGSYGSPYYGGSYGYGYGYPRCQTVREWDRYYRRYVTRQVC